MSIFTDDRTAGKEEFPYPLLKTHTVIVAMTDRFMSGWGKATRTASYAGWACRPEDLEKVEAWVRSRSDAMRVRVCGGDWKSKRGHTHIYVVKQGHPALDFRWN